MSKFEILQKRLTNGSPFRKIAAQDRITDLLDNLEITKEEAEQLTALAEKNGDGPSYPEQIEQLKSETDMLKGCVLEMSEIIYA